MNRWIAWLRGVLPAQAVTFFSGLLTSLIVRALFGQVIPLDAGILMLLTTALVVIATAVLVSLRQELTTGLLQTRLSAKVHHAEKTENGDAPLYDPIIPILASAKESIRVIGLYRPPSLAPTEPRGRYYAAIDNLLESKRRSGQRFRYERILQVKKVRPGKLSFDQVDPVTFDHCSHVVALREEKTALSLHLRQIPDILGSMSCVIVDDKEIIFAVPTVVRSATAELKAANMGTALVFTDNDGSLVKEMLNLFDDLRLDSSEVLQLQTNPRNSE